MKTIKLFVALVATMMAGNMYAQSITANDVEIEPGKTAEVSFTINSETKAAIAEFKLALPEGIAIQYSEDDEDFAYELGSSMTIKSHSATIKKQESGNFYVLVSNASGKEFKAESGVYLTVTLEAAENAVSGVATMKSIILGDLNAQKMNTADEATFNITVNTTGIKSIEAADADAPAYNLAGQKVNKGFKGLVIVNGKKVVK
jgi:hypothetical protein